MFGINGLQYNDGLQGSVFIKQPEGTCHQGHYAEGLSIHSKNVCSETIHERARDRVFHALSNTTFKTINNHTMALW